MVFVAVVVEAVRKRPHVSMRAYKNHEFRVMALALFVTHLLSSPTASAFASAFASTFAAVGGGEVTAAAAAQLLVLLWCFALHFDGGSGLLAPSSFNTAVI